MSNKCVELSFRCFIRSTRSLSKLPVLLVNWFSTTEQSVPFKYVNFCSMSVRESMRKWRRHESSKRTSSQIESTSARGIMILRSAIYPAGNLNTTRGTTQVREEVKVGWSVVSFNTTWIFTGFINVILPIPLRTAACAMLGEAVLSLLPLSPRPNPWCVVGPLWMFHRAWRWVKRAYRILYSSAFCGCHRLCCCRYHSCNWRLGTCGFRWSIVRMFLCNFRAEVFFFSARGQSVQSLSR